MNTTITLIPSCHARSMIPSAMRPTEIDRPKAVPNQPVQRIDDPEAAIEETLIRIGSNPSYGLRGKLEGIKRKFEDEAGVVFEVGLTVGAQLFLCVSETKAKLRRLLLKYRRKSRKMAWGVLARIGDSFDNLRVSVANCVRSAISKATNAPDPEEELQRRRLNRINHRWTPQRNLQPAYA